MKPVTKRGESAYAGAYMLLHDIHFELCQLSHVLYQLKHLLHSLALQLIQTNRKEVGRFKRRLIKAGWILVCSLFITRGQA